MRDFVTYLDLGKLLNLGIAKGASDLHLIAFSPLLLRIHGAMQPVADMPPLTPDDISQGDSRKPSLQEPPVPLLVLCPDDPLG